MATTRPERDALLDVIRALPELARTTETISAIAEAVAAADPSYWLVPLKPREAAAFLGMSEGALATARYRGTNSPPWSNETGAVRYACRLTLMHWLSKGLDVQPSGRRAA
jgi:hypothetical protein